MAIQYSIVLLIIDLRFKQICYISGSTFLWSDHIHSLGNRIHFALTMDRCASLRCLFLHKEKVLCSESNGFILTRILAFVSIVKLGNCKLTINEV